MSKKHFIGLANTLAVLILEAETCGADDAFRHFAIHRMAEQLGNFSATFNADTFKTYVLRRLESK